MQHICYTSPCTCFDANLSMIESFYVMKRNTHHLALHEFFLVKGMDPNWKPDPDACSLMESAILSDPLHMDTIQLYLRYGGRIHSLPTTCSKNDVFGRSHSTLFLTLVTRNPFIKQTGAIPMLKEIASSDYLNTRCSSCGIHAIEVSYRDWWYQPNWEEDASQLYDPCRRLDNVVLLMHHGIHVPKPHIVLEKALEHQHEGVLTALFQTYPLTISCQDVERVLLIHPAVSKELVLRVLGSVKQTIKTHSNGSTNLLPLAIRRGDPEIIESLLALRGGILLLTVVDGVLDASLLYMAMDQGILMNVLILFRHFILYRLSKLPPIAESEERAQFYQHGPRMEWLNREYVRAQYMFYQHLLTDVEHGMMNHDPTGDDDAALDHLRRVADDFFHASGIGAPDRASCIDIMEVMALDSMEKIDATLYEWCTSNPLAAMRLNWVMENGTVLS